MTQPPHRYVAQDCAEYLDELLTAVKATSDWRQRVMEDHGVRPPTAYHRILLYLYLRHYNKQEPPLLSELAERVLVSHQSMSNIIRRMAFDGLVSIKSVDGKSKQVVITNEGIVLATT